MDEVTEREYRDAGGCLVHERVTRYDNGDVLIENDVQTLGTFEKIYLNLTVGGAPIELDVFLPTRTH